MFLVELYISSLKGLFHCNFLIVFGFLAEVEVHVWFILTLQDLTVSQNKIKDRIRLKHDLPWTHLTKVKCLF